MFDNLGRWHVATIVVLALGVLCTAIGRIDLGLDLRGGSALLFRMDFEELIESGALPANEKEIALEQTVEIVQRRIDSLGLREIGVLKQPQDDGFLVELPGVDPQQAESIKSVITNLGRLEFHLIAAEEDAIDIAAERAKLETFLAGKEIDDRVELPADIPSTRDPNVVFRWAPNEERVDADGKPLRTAARFDLLRIDKNYEFRGEDLSRTFFSQDRSGLPAVGFEFSDVKKGLFGTYTKDHKGRQLAILLDGKIATAPQIKSEIPGSGIIQGPPGLGFTTQEVKELLVVLRSGSLRVKPILESETTIGATLGEDSIQRGRLAGILAVILVGLFMIVYYRRLGGVAVYNFLLNIFLILAALFLFGWMGGATLTLPGIGGIVLTIGMAVDANILIYERVREEREKGKTVTQSVRNAYERAAVTILDSNLTTLLTALILAKVGQGPVKGFAITLALGILANLFASLVATRSLLGWLHARGWLGDLGMMRILKNPSWRFLKTRRVWVVVSTLACIVSLVAFFARGREKYGLDLAGGYLIRARLVEPQSAADIRARVASLYEGTEISAILEPGSDSSRASSRAYSIKVSMNTAEDRREEAIAQGLVPEDEPMERLLRRDLREVLGDMLLPDPVQDVSIEPGTEGGAGRIAFTLNFERVPDVERVREVLEGLNLTDLELTPSGEGLVLAVSGRSSIAWTPHVLLSDLVQAFGVAAHERGKLALASPFPETSYIGAKVVRTLRDKAILGAFFSLLGILAYIRLRFKDMAFAVGAIVALAHDAIIALGAVVIADWSGLIHSKIDLPMVAAILTLIGYSINDTIVLYDRVRENLPRVKGSLEEILDLSVNQTLSRTLLTSLTSLFSVSILFALNYGLENVLEGFSWALLVGVVTGTYSSLYIASPVVLWLRTRSQTRKEDKGRRRKTSPRKPQPAAAR